ncbi:uncharacterized protein LOC129939219 [Eupeodes corollae]|uniref:uncharacterized protein LOC129939219 n=1 Tax=Eupeodes corollae TaxID=290404 RepID=UPI0024913EB8|nr:uncharacterized protein LOC129939219 [Eupeodes corollae]
MAWLGHVERMDINPSAWKIFESKLVQRTACVGTTGAMRTCPTDTLNVILDLLPIDLLIKYIVSCSAIRLKESNSWLSKPYGHSNTTKFSSDIISVDTDYCTPTLSLSKCFKVIFPSREDWEDDIVSIGFDTTTFTDGLKMECGVGSGIFSESLNVAKSFRLPDFASVFQAELLAIKEACKIVKQNQNGNAAIFTDNQAAVKAIH